MSGAGDLTATRARAWKLERGDGVVLGFTDHDRDLVIDGLACRAGTGMTARALSQATGLAVDNTEAAGALSDSGLTEADILAGRWDGATLTIWEVDWTEPEARRVLFRGSLGEIARQGAAFRVELRGLTEALQQGRGRVFGPLCPLVLGEPACGINTSLPGFVAQLPLAGLADDGSTLLFPADVLDGFPPGWFSQGRVTFLDGAAAGLVVVSRSDRAEAGLRRLALWAAPGVRAVPGDQVRIEAGCDKRFATCRDKFSNYLNFRGFPDLPGEDWLFATPTEGATGGRREGRPRAVGS